MEIYDYQEMHSQSGELCEYASHIIQDICQELERLETENKKGEAASEILKNFRCQIDSWSDQNGK